jgi:hypothetical protein
MEANQRRIVADRLQEIASILKVSVVLLYPIGCTDEALQRLQPFPRATKYTGDLCG